MRDARIAPGQQILQDEIFEVGTTRLFDSGQVERHADVAPVDLGRLDQALGTVDRIGRQPHEEERGLQQVEPSVHGRLGQRHVALLGLRSVDNCARSAHLPTRSTDSSPERRHQSRKAHHVECPPPRNLLEHRRRSHPGARSSGCRDSALQGKDARPALAQHHCGSPR